MASTILIKRGLKANLPILDRGELAYATDTKELFIGVLAEPTVVGDNVLISDITKSDFDTLVTTGLVWNSGDEELSVDFADGTEALEVNNIVKVMSPQRTDEAITARLNATLVTSDVASESYVDGKIDTLPGTGLTLLEGTLNIDNPFNPSGDFANLRARATTAEDVDLGNVTNESKVTMFNNPTFTNTVTIAGDNPKLTGLPLPVNSTDAANKTYVDNLTAGLKARTSAWVLVDFNLAGTYDSNPELHELESSTNGAFPDVDGILSAVLNEEGARLLLIGQTNKNENGLYVLETPGDASTPWVIRRCKECATSEAVPGSYIFIAKGDVYQSTGWVLEVDNPTTFVIGTDDINAIQFSGAGVFTDGNGLTLDGSQFAIDTTITMDLPSAQTVTGVKTFSQTIVGSVNGSAASLVETNNSNTTSIWVGTEAQYNAIGTKNSNTLYFIEE